VQVSEQKKIIQPTQNKPMFALSASLLSDTLNKMKERNKIKESSETNL